MQGLADAEDELSCIICSSVFTDPRVLACGHSFCAECIAKWRLKQPHCPMCREPIGHNNPPKNSILASIVDRYNKQAAASGACDKCGRDGPDLRVCLHCRHPLCQPCRAKHADKLKLRSGNTLNRLEPLLENLKASLDPLLTSQDNWNRIRDWLAKALSDANSRVNRIDQEVAARTELLQSSRDRFSAMKAATAKATNQDAALYGRTIKEANCMLNKLENDQGAFSLANADVEAQIDALINQLAILLDSNEIAIDMFPAVTEPIREQQRQPDLQAPVVLGPGRPSRALLSEYYSRFPQRFSNYFTVVGSIVDMTVTSNTQGYQYGQGKIVSDATAASSPVFRPLPDEIIIILEGVPPTTKVKVYDILGALKGNIDMKLADGSSLRDAPSFCITANSVNQLLAVSVPKRNLVLVTMLDGTHKLCVTSCSGLDLDNPMGLFLTDNALLYIADFRNRRVCSISCETGQAVRVFTHNSLSRVDRLFVANDGTVLARVEPCHLVLLDDKDPLPANLRQIKRQFFHFYIDQHGSLVFSSGGGLLSGQLCVMNQPFDGSSNPEEKKLISWPDMKYSCVCSLLDGRIVAAAANKKEIHFY